MPFDWVCIPCRKYYLDQEIDDEVPLCPKCGCLLRDAYKVRLPSSEDKHDR